MHSWIPWMTTCAVGGQLLVGHTGQPARTGSTRRLGAPLPRVLPVAPDLEPPTADRGLAERQDDGIGDTLVDVHE